VLTSETKRRLDACRDLLVGKLPLPTDQVELITLALIYKFMDDLDEESVAMGGKRSFFTGPLAQYRWRALLPQTVSGDQRVALFSEGVEAIGNAKTGAHLPELFRDIFRNAFLKFRDGRILTLFLNEVNGFAYSHSEELGNAFEYLLQCMGTQGENGQFRTPRHIIDWIVACLDPQPTDKILDPACGTGGFLVSAYRHILQKHTSPGSKLPGDQLGHGQRQRLYANFTGYDITDLMVKLSKVNLFLHQFPSPAIHIYDSLSNDARWSEKADLILANPPFMTPKGGVTPHTRFRVPAKKAEVLFTDYIAEHLKPDGRAGIIVPNGIVATTQNAYVSLRRFLVEDSLVAVVSLPAGVFKPYSGVKTSILLLDKKLARRTDKILFLKITADGFDLGDQRREITANDLPEAERVMKAWFAGKLADDFASALPWKLVEKKQLLQHRAASLQVEAFLGDESRNSVFEIAKLGDVAEVIAGQSPPGQSYNEKGDGLPFYQGKADFGDVWLQHPRVWTNQITKRAQRDDILMSVRAPVGPVNLCPQEICIGRGLAAIRPSESVLRDYVFHFLRTNQDNIRGNDGAVFPSISRDQIAAIEIPLPPLEEQRRIVAEIEGYQQVIDGARQILAAYRPRLTVDPEWEIVTLGEVCNVQSGGTPSRSNNAYWGGSIPWVGSTVCKDGKVRSADEFITEEGLENSAAKLFRTKTTLIALVGATIGKTGFLEFDCTTNQNIAGLFPLNTDQLLPDFLFLAVQGLYPEFLRLGEDQFRMANLSFVRSQKIPLPPLPEQRRIVAELDAEAAEVAAVRALIPRYEAKIQRVLARVWGTAT
jgi:type I restriction enzyme M protein